MKKTWLMMGLLSGCILVLHTKTASANNMITTDSIAPDPKDVTTVDGILHALYDVISGPAGQARNWDRMRTLFIPEARLIPTGKRVDGTTGRRVWSVEDWIKNSEPFLLKNGFFEIEIARKTDQYGNVMQVFSTYVSKKAETDEKPMARGINSIQLWFDGSRWWIVTVFWQNESPEFPIPEKYLPAKK